MFLDICIFESLYYLSNSHVLVDLILSSVFKTYKLRQGIRRAIERGNIISTVLEKSFE